MAVRILPISDLRRKTSDVIRAVQEGGDAVYITQHGRPIVVLVDYARYEHLLREAEAAAASEALRRSPDLRTPRRQG